MTAAVARGRLWDAIGGGRRLACGLHEAQIDPRAGGRCMDRALAAFQIARRRRHRPDTDAAVMLAEIGLIAAAVRLRGLRILVRRCAGSWAGSWACSWGHWFLR